MRSEHQHLHLEVMKSSSWAAGAGGGSMALRLSTDHVVWRCPFVSITDVDRMRNSMLFLRVLQLELDQRLLPPRVVVLLVWLCKQRESWYCNPCCLTGREPPDLHGTLLREGSSVVSCSPAGFFLYSPC